MKKVTALSLSILLLTSCMGHEARPVPMHEAGDEQKSCAALMAEMTMIEGRVSKLSGQDKGKNTSNAIWGITGVFLYVPLLMLDLSDSEKIEMQAYEDRYRTLAVIAVNKGCDPKHPPTPPAPPPVNIPFAPATAPAPVAPAAIPAAPAYAIAPAPIASPAVQSARTTLPPITDMPPPATSLPAITEMPAATLPAEPPQAPAAAPGARYLPDSRYRY